MTTARKLGTGLLHATMQREVRINSKGSCHRQESSEDEYEENETTAKKLGMISDKKAVAVDKKPSGIQVYFLSLKDCSEAFLILILQKISMMLQRQAQAKLGKVETEGDCMQNIISGRICSITHQVAEVRFTPQAQHLELEQANEKPRRHLPAR